ncbi:DEAD/DEAH box helicase [Rhizobiales bacterium]|uniref:DEAD/DEAH box helicase n=1 Tax=Hongsoonwoonella zoysiae TaxID=2821844 RepID=UPI0015604E7E|nr:DEAD/DEAH box helicase [Hongsoonwoonella zoysiae]NRG17082.1 DEAD/DEAH box helicase [Hongsoonwoonella zoysiae]
MPLIEGAHPALARALEKRGYSELTPIQTAVLELETPEADLLVSAQTGSGKTVAFGLAIAPTLLGQEERFSGAGEPSALAIAPTRELALQVAREFEWLYGETGVRIATCVGGMDMRKERRALSQGAHIVVGTPGRLRDHVERGYLDLSALRVVVLDEADEMLDLGFREDLEFILDAAPESRRTLLFSATVPRPIVQLAKRFQKDALRLSTIEERAPHGDIDYRAYPVAPADRENAIVNVLRFHEADSAIVFCATREAVKHLSARLSNRGFSVVALSGELSQSERTHALQAMRDRRARICVATDVAARGLDLPNLDLVIHADLPTGREALLHRSGRTGRAGRKGVSAVIVPYTRRRAAERLLGSAGVEVNWAQTPTADDIRIRDRERILDDPSLTGEAGEEDVSLAEELLERHGATKIASAYLRLLQARYPAPEDLIEAVPARREEGERRAGKDRPDRAGGRELKREGAPRQPNFEGGVWFRISLGRKHRADPRWLLPMICRAGHVTKREVGTIRINEADTRVEISPEAADRFWQTIVVNGTGEKNVKITLSDEGEHAPSRGRSGYGKPKDRKPYGEKKTSGKPPAKKFKAKSRGKKPAGD